MSGYRLERGGDIDRSRPINFRWEGRSYTGFAGDTLASALLASGVRMIGRSFKYHRPRGLIAAGLDEPNFIVQLERGAGTTPNLKAPYVELYDGLDAAPVNAWPSLRFDLLAANSIFKRFIPAAFYYKTFMWPTWRLFEPLIRKVAGLGASPKLPRSGSLRTDLGAYRCADRRRRHRGARGRAARGDIREVGDAGDGRPALGRPLGRDQR
jgi:sarcosine oxidase subunit alpha